MAKRAGEVLKYAILDAMAGVVRRGARRADAHGRARASAVNGLAVAIATELRATGGREIVGCGGGVARDVGNGIEVLSATL